MNDDDTDRKLEALATAIEALEPLPPRCPICLMPLDDDGWDDCGCFYDLCFHD